MAGSASAEPARFTTAALDGRDRVAIWREVFGRNVARLDLEPIVPGTAIRCEITGYSFPRLSVARGTYRNVRSTRTRELSQDGNGDLIFAIVLRGAGRLSRPGREFALNAGDAALSCNAVVGLTAEAPADLQLVNFAVPSRSLEPLIREAGDIRLIPSAGRSEAVRLLRAYAQSLFASDVRPDTPEMQHLVTTHILDLIAVAVGTARDAVEIGKRRGVRVARLQANKTDVARQANDPSISVEWLAQRHRLSTSYIRKLFDGDGTTFGGFLLEMRLQRAHRLLCDPRLGGRPISAIAFESGFGDLSYFNRCFRKRYSCTPSDVRVDRRGEA